MNVFFHHAIRLAWAHEDDAEITGQRRIVRVDGVQRQIDRSGQFQNLGPRIRQLPTEFVVLLRGEIEVWWVMESQLPPTCDSFWPIPPCISWRTHHDTRQLADH